jgi:hypothetical protein
MKKILFLAIVIAAALFLTSCGGSKNLPTTEVQKKYQEFPATPGGFYNGNGKLFRPIKTLEIEGKSLMVGRGFKITPEKTIFSSSLEENGALVIKDSVVSDLILKVPQNSILEMVNVSKGEKFVESLSLKVISKDDKKTVYLPLTLRRGKYVPDFDYKIKDTVFYKDSIFYKEKKVFRMENGRKKQVFFIRNGKRVPKIKRVSIVKKIKMRKKLKIVIKNRDGYQFTSPDGKKYYLSVSDVRPLKWWFRYHRVDERKKVKAKTLKNPNGS